MRKVVAVFAPMVAMGSTIKKLYAVFACCLAASFISLSITTGTQFYEYATGKPD